MRNELEQIQYIEQYLEGKLGYDDRTAFEKELNVKQELREAVDLQRALIERVEVQALRQAVQQVRAQRGSNGFYLGALIIIICVAASLVAYWKITGHASPLVADGTASVTRKKQQDATPPAAAVATYTTPAANTLASVRAPRPKKERTDIFAPAQSNTVIPNTGTVTPLVLNSSTVIPAAQDTVALAEEFRKNFTVPFARYNFDALTKQVIVDKRSNSSITIPPGILLDRKGKPVFGEVTLIYREFRDAADMAYSGIPMTHRSGKANYDFNSAGMFELYILQGADTLKLKEYTSVQVDFQMTQSISGLSFYKLDKAKNTWKELAPIEARPTAVEKKDMLVAKLGELLVSNAEGKILTDRNLIWFRDMRVTERPIYMYDESTAASIIEQGPEAGHAYPGMIRGLVCAEFGVYNCDQLYRIGRSVAANPALLDASNNPISKLQMLTVIDISCNASFSYSVNGFKFNPKSRNVVLLFTRDCKVYGVDADQFGQQLANNSKLEALTMADLSQVVKNTDDLRKFIGLKK